MKICPRCAEPVQDAAKVCRYCGHQFRDPLHYAYVALAGLFAVIVLMFTLSRCQRTDAVPPQKSYSFRREYGVCDRLMVVAEEKGLLRKAVLNRVYVEGSIWRRTDAASQSGFILSAKCALSKRNNESALGVSVYDERTGKLLGIGNAAGINLAP